MSAAQVFVGAGSNLRPAEHLARAVQLVRARFGGLRLSAVYRNAAIGFDGDDFLNLVLGFRTDTPPHEVMAELRRVEWACGRQRGAKRHADRSLDLDMLLYGDLIVQQPGLNLPRPDLLTRAFVLRPMSELEPQRRHPVTGRSYAEHWAEFDRNSHPMTQVEVAGLAAE